MGGTVIGRVDCVSLAGGAANGNQEVFTNLYQFMQRMVTATYATLIASQYGSGGTGFDFHDGGNPSGENAWAVFRMNTSTERPGGGSELGAYYVLIQWADTAAFGTAPGDPGKLGGSTVDGVGVAVAYLEDGTSPWNGTTNADGTDSKGTPVWVPGGSTLHVMDRSCQAVGGTYATNRENCVKALQDVGVTQSRFHLLADEDSLLFLVDNGLASGYDLFYAGIYEPLSYLTVSYPMACILDIQLPPDSGQAYGGLAGNSAREGALTGADLLGPITGTLYLGWANANVGLASWCPNPQGGNVFDEAEMLLIAANANPANYGWCGKTNFFGIVFNSATHDANAALDKATFGWTVTNAWHIVVPWGGGQPPGTGVARTGRDF